MIVTDLVYITLIVVAVFYSGFPFEIESMIDRRVKFGRFKLPKPFSCQLCMTFWCTLIYTLCTGAISLPNILICLLLALSTTAVESAYRLVFDTLETFLVKINELINS